MKADRDTLARTLNDNMDWIKHVCYTLYRISKSGLYLEPFEVSYRSGMIIPYKPNIGLVFVPSDHGKMWCEFSYGEKNEVVLLLTQSKVDVTYRDKSGIVLDFLYKLATDQGVFRKILENYYNIARAAVTIVQNRRDEENRPERINDIYNTMFMIEDAYINTYGESVTANEETVQKLIRLYEWYISYINKIQNLGEQMVREAPDVFKTLRLRYSDCVTIGDDKSICTDVKLTRYDIRYKIRLITHAFNRREIDIFEVLTDIDVVTRSINIKDQLKCFECLDDVLSSSTCVEKVVDNITDLYGITSSLRQKTFKGL